MKSLITLSLLIATAASAKTTQDWPEPNLILVQGEPNHGNVETLRALSVCSSAKELSHREAELIRKLLESLTEFRDRGRPSRIPNTSEGSGPGPGAGSRGEIGR